jgi:pimeloyl-ACP methyl ester carboxylesterase
MQAAHAMHKFYVEIPEGQIHVRKTGTGPALMLFHQAPLSGVEWEAVMQRLAPRFTVYAPDMIGHGESCDPPRECTMADFTRCTLAVMDAIGVERAALAGNHSGAALALSIALAQPQRVSHLAVSCEMLVTAEQIAAFVARLRSQPLSRDLPYDEEGRFLVEAWERYRRLAPTAPAALRFKPFIVGQAARLRPFDAHHGVLGWLSEREHIWDVRCPLLVLGAEHDLFFDRERLDEAARRLPHCRTQVIPDAGAMSVFEQPERWADALHQFLTS